MLQNIKARIVALAATTTTGIFAATQSFAQNANVRGALDTNQEALTALQDSTFTEDGVESAAQATTNAMLFGLGAIGIGMAAWGIWKLYKISSEGDQARDSSVGPIVMICLGGLMTIAAIVTGIFPNLFVGASAGGGTP